MTKPSKNTQVPQCDKTAVSGSTLRKLTIKGIFNDFFTDYKDKESIDFDMKWFVEKDLGIQIEKIPLYVTKQSLNMKARQLYYALNHKIYYNTLFEWIDNCYPNKFIELDFDINPYRSVFDSLEEAQVDEQIRNRVGNLIHNERNKPNTVNIKGMIPTPLITKTAVKV